MNHQYSEYSPHMKVFDVTLQNGPWDRLSYMKYTVMADSFQAASRIAVLRANAQLVAWEAANDHLYSTIPNNSLQESTYVPFGPEHVTKMEVVHTQVTIEQPVKSLFNEG